VCRKIPVITTLFHFLPRRGNVFYKLLVPMLYFGSRKIHFHDERFMSLFARVLPFLKNRTVFIPVGNMVETVKTPISPNSVDLRRKLGLDDSCRYTAFFGYWYRSKGVDLLLRAFSLVAGKRPEVRLLLVGGLNKDKVNSYEKYILSLIEKLGLNGKVIVTGQCPDATAVEYMLCSDFCVFPFRSNTAGRTSIMLPINLGIPIILAGRAEKNSVFRDKENVVLVEPGNCQNLAETIEMVWDDEELRRRIASNLPVLAAHFSWDRIARQWLEEYGSILRPRDNAVVSSGPLQPVKSNTTCSEVSSSR
jgi:glycosyltransferase involved in cell wall biosynthesis